MMYQNFSVEEAITYLNRSKKTQKTLQNNSISQQINWNQDPKDRVNFLELEFALDINGQPNNEWNFFESDSKYSLQKCKQEHVELQDTMNQNQLIGNKIRCNLNNQCQSVVSSSKLNQSKNIQNQNNNSIDQQKEIRNYQKQFSFSNNSMEQESTQAQKKDNLINSVSKFSNSDQEEKETDLEIESDHSEFIVNSKQELEEESEGDQEEYKPYYSYTLQKTKKKNQYQNKHSNQQYDDDHSCNYKNENKKNKFNYLRQHKAPIKVSSDIMKRHERNFYPYMGVKFAKCLKIDEQFKCEIRQKFNEVNNPIQYIQQQMEKENIKSKGGFEKCVRKLDYILNHALDLWIRKYLPTCLSKTQNSNNQYIMKTHLKREEAFNNRGQKCLLFLENYL